MVVYRNILGKKHKHGTIKDPKVITDLTYNNLLCHMFDIVCRRFKWKNLPDSVNERFLEQTLYYSGSALFFHDDILGYLCLPFAGNNLDVYSEPIEREAYGTNYHKLCDKTDSVICYNNASKSPSDPVVIMYANRITNFLRTIDTNVRAQKTPAFASCNEETRESFMRFFRQWDEDSPLIVGDSAFNFQEAFQPVNLRVEFVSDSIKELINTEWSDFFTWFGIHNFNSTKKERLVSDEVSYDESSTFYEGNSGFQERKEFCEAVNKMFGLNISVEYAESSVAPMDPPNRGLSFSLGGGGNSDLSDTGDNR